MKCKCVLIGGALFALMAGTARPAFAGPAPSGCSMLTPAEIEKVLGQPFGAPSESKAPPAYGVAPWGSHCDYASEKGSKTHVTFIVYADATAAQAKQTFDSLSLWFAPKSKPAIGDEAYIDSGHAIHVRKGKVRYYISLEPANEKQLKDLATDVASRM